MIIGATIAVLTAWLVFVWTVDPDGFMRRTSKRMARPPIPTPEDENGAGKMYTVSYEPLGCDERPPHRSDQRRSRSFVDLPEALFWALEAAAGRQRIFSIEGIGMELDRRQANACLERLRLCSERNRSGAT